MSPAGVKTVEAFFFVRSALCQRYVVQAIVSSFLPLSGVARGPRRGGVMDAHWQAKHLQ